MRFLIRRHAVLLLLVSVVTIASCDSQKHSENQPVLLWDRKAATGNCVPAISQEFGIGCVYNNSRKEVDVFELSNGKDLHSVSVPFDPTGLLFLPNGKLIASSSEGRSVVIDTRLGNIDSEVDFPLIVLRPQVATGNHAFELSIYYRSLNGNRSIMTLNTATGVETIALDLKAKLLSYTFTESEYELSTFAVIDDNLLVGIGNWLFVYSLPLGDLRWSKQIEKSSTIEFLRLSEELVLIDCAQRLTLRIRDGSVVRTNPIVGEKLLAADDKYLWVSAPSRPKEFCRLWKIDLETNKIFEFVLDKRHSPNPFFWVNKTCRNVCFIGPDYNLNWFDLPSN